MLTRFRFSRCPGRPRDRWDVLALNEAALMADAMGIELSRFLLDLKKQSLQKKAFKFLHPSMGDPVAQRDVEYMHNDH